MQSLQNEERSQKIEFCHIQSQSADMRTRTAGLADISARGPEMLRKILMTGDLLQENLASEWVSPFFSSLDTVHCNIYVS